MNFKENINQFTNYYNGRIIETRKGLVFVAKGSKDLNNKMADAWLFICSLGLNLKPIKKSSKSFTLQPIV